MSVCGSCGGPTGAGDMFCISCGETLRDAPEGMNKHCPDCMLDYHTSDRFCIHCGGTLELKVPVERPDALAKRAAPQPSHQKAVKDHGDHGAERTLTRLVLEREKETENLRDDVRSSLNRMEQVEEESSRIAKAVGALADHKKKDAQHTENQVAEIRKELALLHAAQKQEKHHPAWERMEQQLEDLGKRVDGLALQGEALRREEQRLDELKATAEELDKMLATVSLNVHADVQALEKQVAGGMQADNNRATQQQKTLDELKQKTDALDATLAMLETRSDAVPQLQADIPPMTHGFSPHDSRLAEVEQMVSQLEKTVTALQLRDSGQIRQIRQQLTDMQKRDGNLKEHLDTLAQGHTEIRESLEALSTEQHRLRDTQHALRIPETFQQDYETMKQGLEKITALAAQLQEASDTDIHRELALGTLRRELADQLQRVEAVEARLDTPPSAEGPPIVAFDAALRYQKQEPPAVAFDAALRYQKQLLHDLQQQMEHLTGAGHQMEQSVAEQARDITRLREQVASASRGLHEEMGRFRTLMETDSHRVLEKQVAEHSRVVGRLQKGMSTLYAEVGKLVSERGRWAAVVDKEIKERVSHAVEERTKGDEKLQYMADEVAGEFSKINILLNHQEKRVEMFMRKVEGELHDIYEKKDPDALTRLSQAVVAELDEISFRMQQLEHKAVHADTEEIVEAITTLEHKLESLRALQPIIIE